jgi:NAD(P) transhydrogenase subunit alpha
MSLLIGIPAETAVGESRVAVTPETAKKLMAQGHKVRLQSGAGIAASVPDEAYVAVGVELVDAATAWGSDLVLKVRAPEAAEASHIKSGSTVVGMLEPFNAEGLQRLATAGATCWPLTNTNASSPC